MKKRILNTAFVCQNCKREVLPIPNGSYRNHCPFCLFSLHVDGEVPGDRKNSCKGLMEPTGIRYHTKKGFHLIHRCTRCGTYRHNVICEGKCQPDNRELIQELMYLIT